MDKLKQLLMWFVVANFSACAIANRLPDGIVLDDTTGQPIADAIVVVMWYVDLILPVEGRTECYHVETTKTDASGHFRVPGGYPLGPAPESGFLEEDPREWVIYNVYKPGYAPVDKRHPATTLYLAPFNGTATEWFALSWGVMDCSNGGDSRKNLYRLYAARAAEAAAFAATPEQKERAAYLEAFSAALLVNFSKPYVPANSGLGFMNINPEDSYKKEDLLK